MVSRWVLSRYVLMITYAAIVCMGVSAMFHDRAGWGLMAIAAALVIGFELVISAGLDEAGKQVRARRRWLAALLGLGAIAGSFVPAYVCHAGAEAVLAASERSERDAFEMAKSEKLKELRAELESLSAKLNRAQEASSAESSDAGGPKAKGAAGSNFEKIYGGDVARLRALPELISREEQKTFSIAYPPAAAWIFAVVLEGVKFYIAFGIFCRDLRQPPAPASASPTPVNRRDVAKRLRWLRGGLAGALAASTVAAGAQAAPAHHVDRVRPAAERNHDQSPPSSQVQERALPPKRQRAPADGERPRGRRRRVDAAMLERAMRLRDEGLSWVDVGERVGIPKSTIYDAARRAS